MEMVRHRSTVAILGQPNKKGPELDSPDPFKILKQ